MKGLNDGMMIAFCAVNVPGVMLFGILWRKG